MIKHRGTGVQRDGDILTELFSNTIKWNSHFITGKKLLLTFLESSLFARRKNSRATLCFSTARIADESGNFQFEIARVITLTCEYIFQDNAEDNSQEDLLFHSCPGLCAEVILWKQKEAKTGEIISILSIYSNEFVTWA